MKSLELSALEKKLLGRNGALVIWTFGKKFCQVGDLFDADGTLLEATDVSFVRTHGREPERAWATVLRKKEV